MFFISAKSFAQAISTLTLCSINSVLLQIWFFSFFKLFIHPFVQPLMFSILWQLRFPLSAKASYVTQMADVVNTAASRRPKCNSCQRWIVLSVSVWTVWMAGWPLRVIYLKRLRRLGSASLFSGTSSSVNSPSPATTGRYNVRNAKLKLAPAATLRRAGPVSSLLTTWNTSTSSSRAYRTSWEPVSRIWPSSRRGTFGTFSSWIGGRAPKMTMRGISTRRVENSRNILARLSTYAAERSSSTRCSRRMNGTSRNTSRISRSLERRPCRRRCHELRVICDRLGSFN